MFIQARVLSFISLSNIQHSAWYWRDWCLLEASFGKKKKNVELHLLINAINIDLGIYFW